ncbi:PadR family transcriptional regulator [Flavobacteriaceae bacterium]|nr:PadR family transcriptional regulator [Flavobacteriaceae bacterium]
MSTENFKIQIRKGLLEFCVLQIVSNKEVYASEIIEELKNSKIIVVEGTVYPLLSRLKKFNYIQHNWKESTQGPPRKYYSITDYGLEHLKELIVSWIDINSSVKKLLKTKK